MTRYRVRVTRYTSSAATLSEKKRLDRDRKFGPGLWLGIGEVAERNQPTSLFGIGLKRRGHGGFIEFEALRNLRLDDALRPEIGDPRPAGPSRPQERFADAVKDFWRD